MREYFVIAKKDISRRGGNDPQWPKLIAYSPEIKKFLILEGAGHGLMGGEISLDLVSQEKWREVFEELGVEWFFSFLEVNGMLDSEIFLKKLEAKVGDLNVVKY